MSASRTYQDALDHLNTLIPNLKGKGTVTTLTSSALLASLPPSTKIGTYTSPHLLHPRERISINGLPVPQPLFAHHFFALWDTLSAAPADPSLNIDAGAKPFYFRYLTLLALRIFLAEGVSTAVVECGIGGEYDATNILPPEAVTASIAWHKAGIMKSGVATFTRALDAQPGVMAVLRDRAASIGATLVEVPDTEVSSWSGVPDAKIPGGEFQKRNQALAALAARHHLRVLESKNTAIAPDTSLTNLPEGVTTGLRNATLRGRHEIIPKGRVSYHLDGAHNADSLAQVAAWIAPLITPPNTPFVLVFNQQERDAAELLLGLLAEIKACGVDLEAKLTHAIFTRNDKVRLEDADVGVQERCAEALRAAYPTTKTTVCADLGEMTAAVDEIASAHKEATKVLVTGSMYLVGNLIGFLEPESQF
uniref:tetrahydrofolate synthase n=1 Tax=Colletotrichum fructicola (strain Nara gc5) TaxID=1213859 RepID=L2FP15_COLFN